MLFAANAGQAGAEVEFVARTGGMAVSLSGGGASVALPAAAAANEDEHHVSPGQATVAFRLLAAAAHPAPTAEGQRPGRVNYIIGNDPSRWLSGVQTYTRVRYPEVYPGIDLVYHGEAGQLEYDFVVAPGAEPSAIRLGFDGASGVSVDAAGDLVLETAGGAIRQPKPKLYQQIGGERRSVAGQYALQSDGSIGFGVQAFDRSQTLVIDPTIVYSTYLGGSYADVAGAIAVALMVISIRSGSLSDPAQFAPAKPELCCVTWCR